jgi:hypothetical protein
VRRGIETRIGIGTRGNPAIGGRGTAIEIGAETGTGTATGIGIGGRYFTMERGLRMDYEWVYPQSDTLACILRYFESYFANYLS